MQQSYNLATVASEQGPRAALVVGGTVYDIAKVSGRGDLSSVLAVLAGWTSNREILARIASPDAEFAGEELSAVTLLSPILYPPAVFCAGANYSDHVANMARANGLPPPPSPKAQGLPPFHFLKASRCCVGTGATVKAPSPEFDYEAELVAVIGREARTVTADRALEYVAGFMVGNDLSARDIGFRRQLPRDDVFYHSWLAHKSFENAAPIGPWITPIDQLPHWSQLRLRTSVNGELRQDSLCGAMTFSVEEQIAELSKTITLQPGDVIFTGTPGGTGKEIGKYLEAGDSVQVSIDGIGKVETTII